MEMDRIKLRGCYARLKGLERAIPILSPIDGSFAHDLNDIVALLKSLIGDEADPFFLPPNNIRTSSNGRRYCDRDPVLAKLLQALSYLEHVYQVTSQIMEIGSIYNSIRDNELKARCADLLSAPSAFDRVINQATLVLEDRLRRRSGKGSDLIGNALVNETIKRDLGSTTLKFSDDQGEQEGIANILRGIMGAFRNPTHHQISERFDREEALKFCAFIDNLLRLIEEAQLKS